MRDLLMLLGLGAALLGAAARAEPYPSKSIRTIVSTSAGGVTDLCARILGAFITAKTGQTVVIDNKAGGGGNIRMGGGGEKPPRRPTPRGAQTRPPLLQPLLPWHNGLQSPPRLRPVR